MSALLLVAQLVLQLVLLAGVGAVVVFAVWVLWDCTAGPSADLAREHARRRAVAGVDG